jgi:hypothetical protein
MSQSDMRLHFGLGAASKVNQVDVRWPNGVVERFSAPTINTIQLLTEGSGTSVSP